MNPSPLVIAALLGLTLLLALAGLHFYIAGTQQQRVLAQRTALDEAERAANTPLARLDRLLRRTQPGRAVERRLIASGLPMRPATVVVLLAAAMVGTLLLIGRVLTPFFGFLAATAVVGAFVFYLRRQEDRRRDEFVAQLPDLARVLSNATSAGLALRTSLGMAGEELDEPARSELRHTSEALKVGQPVDDALRDLRERLPSRELSVLVSTLIVSQRAGGSLVTSLRNIATTLDERKELRREIKTTLAHSVYTGYFVTGMGIGALFLMNTIAPGSIDQLTQTTVGRVVLIGACALFAVGLLLVHHVTRIDA